MPRVLLRVWDYLGGFEIPLLEGYGLGYDGIFTHASKSGSIFTGYGATYFKGSLEAFLQKLVSKLSRSLAQIGVSAQPHVEGGSGAYTITYLLGGRRLFIKLAAESLGGVSIARTYTLLEGEEDPGLLEEAASSITPARRVEWRTLEIPDPGRGMTAARLVVPRGWSGSGWLTPTMDIAAKLQGGGVSVEVQAARFLYGGGLYGAIISQYASMMGYGVGSYVDARTYASQLGGWREIADAGPPPLLVPSVTEAIVAGMYGGWHSISSVLAWGEGAAAWVSTVGSQIPGVDAIGWIAHVARAQGNNALNHLIVIMAYARVSQAWYRRVSRESMRAARESLRSARDFTPGSMPSYTTSYTSYSYDSYSTGYDDSSYQDYGNDYSYGDDYTGYDDSYTGYDDYGDYSSYGSSYGDYDDYGQDDYMDMGGDDYMDEEERRNRLLKYRDEPQAQFYVDEEGRVRAYSGDEEAVASYIDDAGFLRDEEHRIIGRVEHGYIYDEETGERVGVLNIDASDDYQIRELEKSMLNPEEQLGKDMFGPSDEEKEDIYPSWVTKRRKDED